MKQFYSFKKIFFSFCFAMISLCAFAQDSFNSGDGWGSGWGIGDAFSSSAGSSLIYTTTNSAGGNTNRYFRLYGNGSPCGEYGPSGSEDIELASGTEYTASTITCGSDKAFSLVVPNTTDNWVFKSAGVSAQKLIAFRIEGAVQTVSGVSGGLTVYDNQSPVITATLSGALSTGQGVYLRYTTDDFSTSTVVAMTGTSTSYTASIPSQDATTIVKYYVFTSGTVTPSGNDADWYTINLNNNSGPNYSYTVLDSTPTIALGTTPTICEGATIANLSYTATTNAPDQYSIVFDAAALTAGFENITDASLSTSPISIAIPEGVATDTYSATLTVKNSTTEAVSAEYSFSITVNPKPVASITNHTGSTVLTCETTTINVTAATGTGYSWSDGEEIVGTSADLDIISQGTYTVTVSNTFGCSSTASVVVTEDKTTTSSETVTACDSYEWTTGNGTIYTESGDYPYVTTDEFGCTNTATLHLTINESTSSSESVTACDSYMWETTGSTYTETGSYTYTSGCDEFVLNLTITPSIAITSQPTSASLCDAVGSTTAFAVAVSEDSEPTYEWQFSEDDGATWTTIESETADDIYTDYTTAALAVTRTESAPANHTKYRVLINNGACDVITSDEAELSIYGVQAATVSFGGVKVCAGVNTTVLTLAAGSIGDIQWKYWDEATSLWINTGDVIEASVLGMPNAENTYTATNLTQSTWFKAVLFNDYCAAVQTNLIRVLVSQPAVGGTITGGGVSVCAGDSSTVLTLTNSSGTRVWQKSVNYNAGNPNAATWTTAGAAGLTFTATNLSTTTSYRVVLSSSPCATAYSTVTTINVVPSLVKKSITGAATVCYGTNSTILTLASGTVGDVQWQLSTDSGITWTNTGSLISATIPSNPAISYTATNLTQTTQFRVVLSNNVCTPVTTATVQITVSQAVMSGTISGGGVNYCSATNTTNLSLNDSSGSSIQWQKSSSATGSFTTITGATSTSYTAVNLAATTWYRAQVSDGACTTTSDAVSITVHPATKSGNIIAPTTICYNSPLTLSLTGYVGSQINWYKVGVTESIGSGVSITTSITANTSFYATVTSGGCTATLQTTTKLVKVDLPSVSGTITGGGLVSSGGSGTVKVIGQVGKIQWEYSTNGITFYNAPKAADIITDLPFSATSASSTAGTYVIADIQEDVYFRARITSGTCSSVYTDVVVYEIRSGAEVGTITPSSTTVCPGTGTTLTLSSATGTITWQKSTTFTSETPAWAAISNNNTTTLTTANLTASTAYRAKVTLGPSSTVYSNIVIVAVVAKPVAKALSANTTSPTGKTVAAALCTSNTVTKVITIGSGYSGAIQWQASTTSATTGFADIEGETGTSYTVTDPAVGANYYRAKLTNSCGVAVFSAANTVYYKDCAPAKASLASPFAAVVYPNPYSEKFNVSLTTSSEETVEITIYDMTGKLIDKKGCNPVTISELSIGESYPSGIYQIVVTQGNELKILRVIKR